MQSATKKSQLQVHEPKNFCVYVQTQCTRDDEQTDISLIISDKTLRNETHDVCL